MPTAPLTDVAVKTARPGPKVRKLSDGGGLYLEVKPNGTKTWRFRFERQGRERVLTFGRYPEMGLKVAREKAQVARAQADSGFLVLPPVAPQETAAPAPPRDTFEEIAREWHTRQSGIWVDGHAEKVLRRFELYLFPWIGATPIRDLTPPVLLKCLRRIEDKGAVETAHRALQTCGQVFRYAIATGRAERDLTADLRGALMPSQEVHRPAILDPAGVGALLRSFDAYPKLATRAALVFGALTFVRPKELRLAEWTEIDEERAEWRIPGQKMKMREQHIVPLARQALEVVGELRGLTGAGRYLFPSSRTTERPMSEATVLAALRALGYGKEEMCGHGFRAMASTLLNENGWPSDVIERQLAHAERNKVRAAYNRAQFLPERRKMMQAWADYLDALKAGKVDVGCAPG